MSRAQYSGLDGKIRAFSAMLQSCHMKPPLLLPPALGAEFMGKRRAPAARSDVGETRFLVVCNLRSGTWRTLGGAGRQRDLYALDVVGHGR